MRIRRIDIRGTLAAVPSCTPCSAGEISDDDRGGCHPCPLNTRVVSGKCEPCPPDTYRLPGPETDCLPRRPCAPADFVEVISDLELKRCDSSNSAVPSYQIRYEPLIPQICNGSAPAPNMSTKCVPCPFGLVYQDGTCKPCAKNTYAKAGKCVAVDSGFAVVPELGFFFSTDKRAGLPTVFTSQCYGEDCSTDGWRLNADGAVESGVHSGEVDNVLTLTLDFVNDPSAVIRPHIEFSLLETLHNLKKRQTHTDTEVEFFVDGVYIPIMSGQLVPANNSIPLKLRETTSHTFKWIFSQGLTQDKAKVALSNLRVFGVKTGGATQQIECPAGHYITSTGVCQSCPVGTHSTLPRSSECAPCPEGSVAARGSVSCSVCPSGTVAFEKTKCIPSCFFVKGPHTYNLTALRSSVETEESFTLSVCMPLTALSTCPDCLDSFVFGRDGGNSYSFGNKLTFTEALYAETDPAPKTFTLMFTQSDRAPPYCTSISTTVDFYCDLSEGRGHPDLALENADTCNPVFKWRSALACRICTEENVIPERSSCIDGKRELIYTTKETCVLSGNYSQPITEPCKAVVEVDETIGGGVALLVIVVVIVLVAIAIVFWKRKRDVENKYERLRGEVPMDDLDSEQVGLDTDT